VCPAVFWPARRREKEQWRDPSLYCKKGKRKKERGGEFPRPEEERESRNRPPFSSKGEGRQGEKALCRKKEKKKENKKNNNGVGKFQILRETGRRAWEKKRENESLSRPHPKRTWNSEKKKGEGVFPSTTGRESRIKEI